MALNMQKSAEVIVPERDKYKFKYDINAILSDLIYARILEPASKRSSYQTASVFFGETLPMNFMMFTAPLKSSGTKSISFQAEVIQEQ